METLIWTDPGLGQYYIRLDPGQILPRSREEGCQQGLTESSVKGRHGFTVRANLNRDEYTYGITRRESEPYGHLAEYRG